MMTCTMFDARQPGPIPAFPATVSMAVTFYILLRKYEHDLSGTENNIENKLL